MSASTDQTLIYKDDYCNLEPVLILFRGVQEYFAE